MITVDHLTKRYGAVDGLSFEVGPGRVTGFLGPNGAGKTTTLRMLLGLARPDGGTATIDGVRYRDLRHPARTVGAALEADCFHPGRSAAEHLRIIASAAGIPRSRVAQVLGLTGLAEAAHRRVGAFSLGMRQRLTLAAALLGDPAVLIMDEPRVREGRDRLVQQMKIVRCTVHRSGCGRASISCQDEPGKRTRRSLTYSPRLSELLTGEHGRVIAQAGDGLDARHGGASPDLPAQALQLSLQRIQFGTGNADQFGCFGAHAAPSVRRFSPSLDR
jgi:ABC-type Na+ transport system ATPase subunit NatA